MEKWIRNRSEERGRPVCIMPGIEKYYSVCGRMFPIKFPLIDKRQIWERMKPKSTQTKCLKHMKLYVT